MIKRNGFTSDAEGAGKVAVEIITRRKPKVWTRLFSSLEDEADHVYWLARTAAHWAGKAIDYEESSPAPSTTSTQSVEEEFHDV